MNTQLPTSQDIDELLAFLPRLYAEGVVPVERWHGGSREDGTLTFAWPEYSSVVTAFMRAASKDVWCDYEYEPGQARQMLDDPELVAGASLRQIKTMLTYCVRGERFCDGHWGTMIERGHVRQLLERLQELRSTDAR